MSVAEVAALSSRDAMKPEQKILKPEKEGQDSLDTVIRQAIGREPFLSFSRAGESPVQWIQLLHALDQQGSSKVSKGSLVDNGVGGKEHTLELCSGVDSEMNGVKEFVHPLKDNVTSTKGLKSSSEHMQALKIPEAVVAFAQAAAKANGEPEKYLPGWPLLSPSKVQLQKCDKCSREFCSSVNYRRHIRVHRRSLNIDKDYPKNWEFLGAFWDKLSYDEAKEMVSLTDVAIEEVTGSSIIRALSSWIRKPGFSSLPHMYVRAGAALLDVVQAKAPRFPVSSQELFNMLDDASEKTFLCAGTAVSMQKFMFDGEAGKIALEMKNLIASISFLLEQKLVKAWVADKDAEALRCQKLLVEEEEAAQKRQAELLERKRLKKLRQKEQKAKDLTDVDSKVLSFGTTEGSEGSSSAGTPGPWASPLSDLYAPDTSSREPCPQEPAGTADPEVEADLGLNLCTEDRDQNLDHQVQMGNGRRPLPALQRVPLNPTRVLRNGFNSNQVPAPKSSVSMKHGNYTDPATIAWNSNHKIWTRKVKPENEEEGSCDRTDREHKESVPNDNSEVLIGSISVALGHENGHCQDSISLRISPYEEKQGKPDFSSNNVNRTQVKLWIPVGRHEDGSSKTGKSDKRETRMELSARMADQIPPNENHLSSGRMNCSGSETCADLSVPMLFSSKAVEAFLAQRWKEAIAADHVKLVLPPETGASDCLDKPEGNVTVSQSHSSGCFERSILGSAENRMVGLGSIEPVSGASKLKFRPKPNKNCKLKYVPKQRTNASGE